MEEEKKPKRPRIGAGLGGAVRSSAEPRYEKVNYPERPAQGENQSSSEEHSSGQRPYQPRPYQPRSYGYQQRPYQNRYDRDYQSQQRPYSASSSDSASESKPTDGAADSSASEEKSAEGGYQPRPYQPRPYQPRQQGGYQQRPYQPRPYGQQRQQGGYQQRPYQPRPYGQQQGEGGYQPRPYQPRQQGQGGYQPRPYGQRQQGQGGYQQRPYGQQRQQGGYQQRPYGQRQQGYKKQGARFIPRPKQIDYVLNDVDPNEPVRLNKYMANAGLCSRREADEYITTGKVKVNGEVVTELGTKITRTDVVEFDDKVVTPERKCYVLLNKPKDCVTTSDDPNGRTTVLDIVKGACQERIYPVGRLDRNTTGVLLLTNDGDLASKLTHPKFVKKKIYHVWTDKDIAEEDMQRIADGITLDDGEIHADAISYVSETDRNQAGIEIHSGRNRIVRRIFESLGYRVVKLDRVYFAGLTKKNLPRGRWRYLTQEEVNFLRMGSFE